ncbi:MAG: hypothetical protein ABF665_17890 [Gluconacetobacter sp.]
MAGDGVRGCDPLALRADVVEDASSVRQRAWRAWAITVLAALHVVAALYHAWVLRGGVLRRLWGRA